MARNDFTRKPKKDRTDDSDPDLLAHIRSLGLLTVEDSSGGAPGTASVAVRTSTGGYA